MWQLDPGKVPLDRHGVSLADALEVCSQRRRKIVGQNRDPILRALAVPDDDLRIAEVDVLDAQAKRFEQSQPAAIHQAGQERVLAVEVAQQ